LLNKKIKFLCLQYSCCHPVGCGTTPLAMPLLPGHTVAFAHDLIPRQKLPVHLCNFHPLMLHNKSQQKSYSRLMFHFYTQENGRITARLCGPTVHTSIRKGCISISVPLIWTEIPHQFYTVTAHTYSATHTDQLTK